MLTGPRRLLRLMSRTLCLASVPIVVLAFWDYYFFPLAIKELLTLTLGVITFLCWWVGAPSDDKNHPHPHPLPEGEETGPPSPSGRRDEDEGNNANTELINPLGPPLLLLY